MYVTNIFDDYESFFDHENITNKCTNNGNNIDILIPSSLLTIRCGLSFLCLMSLMVYTFKKPLLKFKQFNQTIKEKK